MKRAGSDDAAESRQSLPMAPRRPVKVALPKRLCHRRDRTAEYRAMDVALASATPITPKCEVNP